jgi:hypothetical protein
MWRRARRLSSFATKCKFWWRVGWAQIPRYSRESPRRSGGLVVLFSALSTQQIPVDAEVQTQYQEAQQYLDVSGESGGIQDRQDVVLDKSTLIRRGAGLSSKGIFQRRQRTNPPGKLDPRAPKCGGYMEVRNPGPAEYEESTKYDEHHEEKVNCDDEIG